MRPRNEAVLNLNLIMSLFQPPLQQTTRKRPSSSPWLTPACGNEPNILVDELYGLLTLKDSVDSARVRMPFHIMPRLFSACRRSPDLLTTARAHLLLALKVKPRRIKYLGILSFSLVSHCCTLQFSPCLLSSVPCGYSSGIPGILRLTCDSHRSSILAKPMLISWNNDCSLK